jgi:hypothetical protein
LWGWGESASFFQFSSCIGNDSSHFNEEDPVIAQLDTGIQIQEVREILMSYQQSILMAQKIIFTAIDQC